MTNNTFAKRIKKHVDIEIEQASNSLKANDIEGAFHHLERAHILGQAVTIEHTRVHWLMLKLGWKKRDWREISGQLFRVVGASTKTPFGIYPKGNTGGANISPFKPLSIPNDLQEIISEAKGEKM
ncbi:MAG TPA: DUF3703 domain-containing protein [Pyrinomonadaceae bacterium]|jgi:hypothetical protein